MNGGARENARTREKPREVSMRWKVPVGSFFPARVGARVDSAGGGLHVSRRGESTGVGVEERTEFKN